MGSLVRFLVRVAALIALAAVAGALYARGRMTSRGEPDDDTVDLVAIFERFELASRAAAFRGGALVTWFGGGTLDLREATLHPDGARLTVYALFGGAQVVVSEHWVIDCRLIGLFGGLGDDRASTSDGAAHHHEEPAAGHHLHPTGPVLTIDGLAAFGGVGVTSEPRGPGAR